jgi:hypothetical protein
MRLFNSYSGTLPPSVRPALRFAGALFLLAFSGCAPSGPEVGLFKLDVPRQVKKMALPDSPAVVKKLIFKEVPEDLDGKTLRGDAVIYEADLDANGEPDYVILLQNPNGVRHFMVVEGGKVLARDYWFELNRTEMRIVSLVKAGECEILFRRPGGSGNSETSYLTLFKKNAGGLKEVFTAEAFRHEWYVGRPEKFTTLYFAASGGELPAKILEYEGELTQDFIKLPKNRPDFETVKSGAKVLKTYRWNEEKFAFTDKK